MKLRKTLISILVIAIVLTNLSIPTLAAEATGNADTVSTTDIKQMDTSLVGDITGTNEESVTSEDLNTSEELSSEDTELVDNPEAPAQEGDITEEEESAEDAKESEEVEKKAVEEEKESKATKKVEAKPKYTQEELKLLSCLIFAEAGNQSYNGKLAVGIVVMNRVRSSSFKNSVKGVIYERNQFTVAKNGMLARQLKLYSGYSSATQKLCIKAAKAALSGETKVGKKEFKNYYYFNTVKPRSRSSYKIGAHYFS